MERSAQKSIKETTSILPFSVAENSIIKLLEKNSRLSYDALIQLSNLSSSVISESLLHLEFENMITALPGKSYKLY